jgi:CHASE3 domain sensor protein
MNIGFFIVGGVIFTIYIGLTLWNIYDSSKKSKAANYPDLKKKE